MRASITWESAPWSAAPHTCFADEIAIDFPSVDAVVDRMRDAFLGDDDTLIVTDVELSPDDAALGASVPFTVPMRSACRECGGRGEKWGEGCEACVGTGEALALHEVRLNMPSGVADGARFRFRVSSPHAAAVRIQVRVVIRSSSSI